MNTDKLIQLSDKIKAKLTAGGFNEEQTKTALILPFFVILGYDIFNDEEFVPEYVADFGVKQGEKVDYAICINKQPIALVECKKLGAQLCLDNISQLFRYYASTDAKIAILTNGDDYWFFADSIKQNQMDKEPYFKLKMSNLDTKSVETLEMYTRENIGNLNISENIQEQRYRLQITEFIEQIKSGNLPQDFIRFIADRFEISGITDSRMAEIFNELYKQIVGYRQVARSEQPNIKSSTQPGKWVRNKSKASNLPIGVPIQFNEGSLTFHKPQSLIIEGNTYRVNYISEVLTCVISYILCNKCIDDKQQEEFMHKMADRPYGFEVAKVGDPLESDSRRQYNNILNTDYMINTSFGSKTLVIGIEKAISIAGIAEKDVKIILAK